MGVRFLWLAAFAVAGLTSGAEPCSAPQSAKDVVRCAVDRSPATERARLTVGRAEAEVDSASGIANPTFSIQSGIFTFNGESRGDHQIAVTQPIDWGGVRGARTREAEGRHQLAEVDAKQTRGEVAYETLLKLHRVRQMEEETRLHAEASATFGKLVALHEGRPSLTPEQQVSLAVFRMAKGDLDLKRSALEEEERAAGTFFDVATGLALAQVRKAVPGRPDPWPPLADGAVEPALRAARARAEVAVAAAQLSEQQGTSWPDFSIGPYLMVQRDGGVTRNLYGLMASIELPIFSLNGGGRDAATKGLRLAERNLELMHVEDRAERKRLAGDYQAAVRALDESPSPEEIEREHARMEKLFLRGVLPSTLAIESHRQFLELVTSRNERELSALRAWWRLKLLEGKLPEAAL